MGDNARYKDGRKHSGKNDKQQVIPCIHGSEGQKKYEEYIESTFSSDIERKWKYAAVRAYPPLFRWNHLGGFGLHFAGFRTL